MRTLSTCSSACARSSITAPPSSTAPPALGASSDQVVIRGSCLATRVAAARPLCGSVCTVEELHEALNSLGFVPVRTAVIRISMQVCRERHNPEQLRTHLRPSHPPASSRQPPLPRRLQRLWGPRRQPPRQGEAFPGFRHSHAKRARRAGGVGGLRHLPRPP